MDVISDPAAVVEVAISDLAYAKRQADRQFDRLFWLVIAPAILALSLFALA